MKQLGLVEGPYEGTKKGAVFSSCQNYRYLLWRTWNSDLPAVNVIGLNPSTADAENDDPTIRRCVDFAKRWGYGQFLMTNLFAFRATNPLKLRTVEDPIGPMNNWWVITTAYKSALILAAWGAYGGDRGFRVSAQIPRDMFVLGLTKEGHPRHPLYVKGDLKPNRWIRDDL